MDEIKAGLRRLLSLGLERQPAADVFQLTLATWFEVLSDRRPSRDRIRAGFGVLVATRRAWPAPADLLAALPRPAAEPRPRRLMSDRGREMGMRSLASIAAKLGIGGRP